MRHVGRPPTLIPSLVLKDSRPRISASILPARTASCLGAVTYRSQMGGANELTIGRLSKPTKKLTHMLESILGRVSAFSAPFLATPNFLEILFKEGLREGLYESILCMGVVPQIVLKGTQA